MDPALELQAVEQSLRLAIRLRLPNEGWLDYVSADRVRLQEKQDEDRKRRDGAIVGRDLLDYVEFHHLGQIILKAWEPHFHPIFSDKKRTEVWLAAIEDVRNAIAHSRQLLQFERDLVAGVSGQLRNQITLFRMNAHPASAHYPLIESVTDSFGRAGHPDNFVEFGEQGDVRVEVGDAVTFDCRAEDPRGRDLEWWLEVDDLIQLRHDGPTSTKQGNNVVLTWNVTEQDVGEGRCARVHMRSTGRFHRTMVGFSSDIGLDDSAAFLFSVNPPLD